MDYNSKTTSELFQMIEESPEQFARNIQKSGSYGWKMSVSAYLDQLLEQYKMSIPDFIAKTYLSKSFVYQIFSGERNPGRDILLRIAFAMNLTLAETQELLMMGQKGALYPKVRRDAALICCLEQRLSLDELLNKKSSLPEASNQKLPVWRGIMNGTMGFVKYQALGGRADKVIREGDIKAAADTGFNHMSIMISFPWLQGLHQKDGYVDKTRLEELDRVIALCMKYDMHVTFTNSETPGISMWGEDEHENGVENIAKPGMAKTYASYWGMLAKRYKGIDNKYLAFNLMCEPGFTSEEQYEKLLGPSVEAIFAVDESRVVIADIHNWGLTGEAMAKMGVALSHHHYDPRDFCVLEGTDYEQDKDYLHSVKWEYTAKDTFDLHAYGDENIASLNDVRKTAEKYGVGFMVGEFGIFGGGQLSKYRYSDETISAYYTSMVKAFEEEGIGWVGGSMDSQWGIMISYPLR